MDRAQKAEAIENIKTLLDESTAVYLVDYNGINVEKISEIRSTFRKEGIRYKVLKNTLFKKAIDDKGGYEKLDDLLIGMNGFVFAGDNFVETAKIIKKVSEDTGKFTFKGCYIDSSFYEAEQLETISKMPSKEDIMAGIVGALASTPTGIVRSLANPATELVGSIGALARDLVNIVDQIAQSKKAA